VLIGSRILLLSPHPGRVRAELGSNGEDVMDSVTGTRLSDRIHKLLFDTEEVSHG
jgi:NitT/TauT family transport system ATP-binding protein